MKVISLLFFLILFANISTAQDVIIKRDGTKIQSKILEVTPTVIKYKNFSQPDGPLRTIQITSVSEIIYDNGEFVQFELKEIEPQPEEKKKPVEEKKQTEQDLLFDNGFFLEIMTGYGFYDRMNYDYQYNQQPKYERINNVAITFRMGNKWYFGDNEKWRPGIQVKWLRFGMYMEYGNIESLIIGSKTITFCNFGLANIIKLSDETGLEANFTVGPNIEVDLEYGEVFAGVMLNPEMKFRYKQFAVGFDYALILDGMGQNSQQQSDPYGGRDWNIFSFSFGLKF